MRFKVDIMETLYRSVNIDARDAQEALDKVWELYEHDDIVLTKEDYLDTEIEIDDDGPIDYSEDDDEDNGAEKESEYKNISYKNFSPDIFISVPVEALDAYQKAETWKEFKLQVFP